MFFVKTIHKKQLFVYAIIVVFILGITVCFSAFKGINKSKMTFRMGATIYKCNKCKDCKSTMKNENSDIKVRNEKYFRPSKLEALNIRDYSGYLEKVYNKKPNEIVLPTNFFTTPEDTIINYYSILREAENIPIKSNVGCGSIGYANQPYSIAYNFFKEEYKKKNSFEAYIKSFENIGHINLIKLKNVPNNINSNELKYFVEIETIESSNKYGTNFMYYDGFIYLNKIGSVYVISNIEMYTQDFLCAPYHGWRHNAEMLVEYKYGEKCKITKTTEQIGYVKYVYIQCTDGKEYRIEFLQLTNGTDVEIAQYEKISDGQWKLVKLEGKE